MGGHRGLASAAPCRGGGGSGRRGAAGRARHRRLPHGDGHQWRPAARHRRGAGGAEGESSIAYRTLVFDSALAWATACNGSGAACQEHPFRRTLGLQEEIRSPAFFVCVYLQRALAAQQRRAKEQEKANREKAQEQWLRSRIDKQAKLWQRKVGSGWPGCEWLGAMFQFGVVRCFGGGLSRRGTRPAWASRCNLHGRRWRQEVDKQAGSFMAALLFDFDVAPGSGKHLKGHWKVLLMCGWHLSTTHHSVLHRKHGISSNGLPLFRSARLPGALLTLWLYELPERV